MNRSDLFRTKSVWSLIAQMSIPALVSILVMLLYNMTDMYFVARTGDDDQVAAVSLVMPVFTFLMAVSTMLGNGACTLIAQALGRKEEQMARVYSSLRRAGRHVHRLRRGVSCVMLPVFRAAADFPGRQ